MKQASERPNKKRDVLAPLGSSLYMHLRWSRVDSATNRGVGEQIASATSFADG